MRITKYLYVFLAFLSPSLTFAAGLTIDPNRSTSLARYLNNVVLRNILNFGAVLAVVFIIIGGIKLVTSAGNTKQLDNAKKTLTFAILGLLLILLAKVIFLTLTGSILPSIFDGGVAPY